jgi:Protein of unknown function (DUF3727)
MVLGFVGGFAGGLVRPTACVAASSCRWAGRIWPAAGGRYARLPAGAAGLRCFTDSSGGNGGGDDDDDDFEFDPNSDENDEYERVELSDPNTGRTLSCVVENSVAIDDVTYYVCCPEDDVVTFASERGEDGLVEIQDEEIADDMFASAAAVMSEDHIVLKRTAFLITADDSDAEIMDGEDEDDDEDYGDDDDDVEGEESDEFGAGEDDDGVESESVVVIGEFCHAGQDYLVVKPEGPILLVARDAPNGKGLVVPDNEELDRVTPLIEARLETLAEMDGGRED